MRFVVAVVLSFSFMLACAADVGVCTTEEIARCEACEGDACEAACTCAGLEQSNLGHSGSKGANNRYQDLDLTYTDLLGNGNNPAAAANGTPTCVQDNAGNPHR